MDSSAHGGLSRPQLDELEALDEAFLRLGAVRDDTGHITDFQYEYCNRAALSVLGRTRDEVVGQRLLQLFPSHRTNGLFDAYTQVAETSFPMRHEFAFDENGVAGEFEVLICRCGDGVTHMGHDITDRKEAERRLTTLAAQLQGALDSRVIIEQAKGYLAAQSDTDPDTGFKALRRYARDHNLRINDVARSTVSGDIDLRGTVKTVR
ncbi:MAG TPA: ANTAR domain-containing protein [Ilumatobacteraceae bacterium]|nr:ANTAR domain-containing protein [Ilumatobacteraceae bacterium]